VAQHGRNLLSQKTARNRSSPNVTPMFLKPMFTSPPTSTCSGMRAAKR
jgi:hypothetical protein